MVAITVILAAVIGTFVLGLGDQVQQTTPQASFGFDQGTTTIEDGTGLDTTTNSNITVTTLTVTHESGDTVEASNLEVTVNGDTAYGAVDNHGHSVALDSVTQLWTSGDVSAGSSVTVVSYTSQGIDFSKNVTYDTVGGSLDIYNSTDDGSVDTDTGLAPGDTVRVIYASPDSDKSSTLAKREVQ